MQNNPVTWTEGLLLRPQHFQQQERYFEWQFATENGFIEWLLLGWIIPAIKGFLWPLFIIF